MSNDQEKNNAKGYLFLFFGIFLWSTIEITLTLVKNENTTPIIINTFRMLIGGLTLLFFIVVSGRLNQFKAFLKTYPKYYVPAAIIGLVLGQIIYINGTQLTEPQLAATIFSSNPIIISLYMMLFRGEERTSQKIVGIIIGFFGVLLIITELKFGALLQEGYLLGNVLVFVGMSLWTVDVILGKLLFNKDQERLAKIEKKIQNNSETKNKNQQVQMHKYQFDSLDFNAITFLLAGIFMLPFLGVKGEIQTLQKTTSAGWWGIVWLGVFTGGLGYLLFFKGLQNIEASKGINAFYFKPIFATILSFLIFQNVPSGIFYVGLVIEIGALVLVSRKTKKGKTKKI